MTGPLTDAQLGGILGRAVRLCRCANEACAAEAKRLADVDVPAMVAQIRRLRTALAHVLVGPWESNGAGDVRSPWIPAVEADGWRRLLDGPPRSERDGGAAPTGPLDPVATQPDAGHA